VTVIVSELDKTFDAGVSDSLGTMSIRVVVLKKHVEEEAATPEDVPLDLDEGEVSASTGKTPTRTYLEDPKRGKECCVFLINGQRQDAWDNSFIVRDLNKKYLRNRMLVMVDLDGIQPEAAAELMSGDRQGFYQGSVYHALSSRLISTLKRDPDLERLEEDAERELAELRGGDEAVKQALDQLIEAHHSQADHSSTGLDQPGAGSNAGTGAGIARAQNVVVGPRQDGLATSGPYLKGVPVGPTVRVQPSETSTIEISTNPADAWVDTSELHVKLTPEIDGLAIERARTDHAERLVFRFDEPIDWEDDQYPLETLLTATAVIKGFDEQRLIERRVLISRPNKRKPPKSLILKNDPSFLRVTSREPVPLATSGADTHVRLRWDGLDTLAVGSPPAWTFSAKCLSLSSFPQMSFSRPNGGRFELLVNAPQSLSPDEWIEFEVVATGPGGKELSAKFIGQVMVAPLPKRLKKVVPERSADRKPPYELKYVSEPEWNLGYEWSGDEQWTAEDVGMFEEPSESRPLILIINEDMSLLKAYRETLLSKKLEPHTIKERVTRYTSHVAYHLYQMYLNCRDADESASKDEGAAQPPSVDQLRGEINRVGATLLKVMSVTH
jgi:hypothetical protein